MPEQAADTLEADTREARSALGRIETLIQSACDDRVGRLGRRGSAVLEDQVGRLDDKVRRVEIELAEVKSRVSQLPTAWMLLSGGSGMILTVFDAPFALLRLAACRAGSPLGPGSGPRRLLPPGRPACKPRIGSERWPSRLMSVWRAPIQRRHALGLTLASRNGVPDRRPSRRCAKASAPGTPPLGGTRPAALDEGRPEVRRRGPRRARPATASPDAIRTGASPGVPACRLSRPSVPAPRPPKGDGTANSRASARPVARCTSVRP